MTQLHDLCDLPTTNLPFVALARSHWSGHCVISCSTILRNICFDNTITMVKRYCSGLCNSNTRYPDNLLGNIFDFAAMFTVLS